MAATDTPTPTNPAAAGGNGQLIPSGHGRMLTRAEELGIQLREAIDLIPESGEEGDLSILRQLFNVTDPAELDAPWRSDSLGAFDGKHVRVESIRKMPSDFQDGLGFYLVCEVTDRSTGERHTVTTGSTSVVGQLARAHQLSALPIEVIPRRSERPSRNGFYPVHLEIVPAAAR